MIARRLLALAAVPFALAAIAPDPAAPPTADHVSVLVGTWTCRTALGAQTHHVGTESDGTLDVVNDVYPEHRRVRLRHASYVANRLVTGMWCTHRRRLRPQEDHARRVYVRVGHMTAADARKACSLPTFLRDVATGGTRLR